MDINDTIAISVSALDAQRHRLNVIASNLANAQSTHTDQGGPYKRRDVVFQAAPVVPKFSGALFKAGSDPHAQAMQGVRVSRIVEDPKPGKAIHDPQHPDADAQGFVQMPNVNVMEEMVNMISASRAYEANVQTISTARTMWNRALDIGR
ncbi:MAG: flagellar basal body rod protein FlgC [Nitrospirota bacterium]|nr:flagellar basal body rod protein FlgC [Nitrospirota bacterium]MDE3034387.1 flagellar basal body rod protein FlgC [Nitrospirota bacterium]MDE3118061.1 flagellar basal body rod protein FlgC [Nitrospirota bacterium]MDE3224727.1 flagellar basal body rod protein FlgC [Nitrospirota bacterium]MDE3243047.1 flagellar basal body rod protein FlgC [Nitrospirota bacterium]